jgi:hypothetical protein
MLAGAGCMGFAIAPARILADVPSAAPGRLDPARAAHDVFQSEVFWWKRIAPRQNSGSWLESILTAVRDFLARLLRDLANLIAKLLRDVFGAFTGDFSGGTTIVVWLVVAALLAWSLWRLYPVIVRLLSGSAPAPKPQEEAAWRALAEASALFQQAGQAFHDGLYAEAIRLALLALIAQLEKQGLLRYDPTRTNREYQRELRQRSELATLFGQLARIYERVWYGRLAAGREEAELAISLCGSVINEGGLSPE